MNDLAPQPATLGTVFDEFLQNLKSEQRATHERYVRHYVQTVGRDQLTSTITSPRVEWYAESMIKANDPLAEARVIALKSWFQYLKRRNHTERNFGTVIRVKRSGVRFQGKVAARSDDERLQVTATGYKAMRQELDGLEQEVPKLVEAIALAREDKDFRENAPLDAAREALAQNESRRKQIAADLRRSQIADGSDTDRAGVGSEVTVTRVESGQQFTYRLVGAREANARDGKISIESPVGRELIGRSAGDEVVVKAPNGELLLRIDDIRSG
ncbi:MAG TPA: transcription elongation factor GreA [Dehalococcoidia bacterium]|nr:transcription elongation factor GreA [Dehalococcoidia bacterium]